MTANKFDLTLILRERTVGETRLVLYDINPEKLTGLAALEPLLRLHEHSLGSTIRVKSERYRSTDHDAMT